MALGCSVGPGKFFRLSGPIMLSSVRTHFPSLLTGQWPGRGLVDGQSQHGRKGFLWPVGCTWAVKKPEQVLGASEGEIPVLRGVPLLPVRDWRSLTALLPVRDWQCLSSALPVRDWPLLTALLLVPGWRPSQLCFRCGTGSASALRFWCGTGSASQLCFWCGTGPFSQLCFWCHTGGSSYLCIAALGLQRPEPALCVCVQRSRSKSAIGPGGPVPGWEISMFTMTLCARSAGQMGRVLVENSPMTSSCFKAATIRPSLPSGLGARLPAALCVLALSSSWLLDHTVWGRVLSETPVPPALGLISEPLLTTQSLDVSFSEKPSLIALDDP